MSDFQFESAMDRISDFMASNSTMPKDAYASIYNSRFRMNSGLRIIEHESIDDIFPNIDSIHRWVLCICI